MDDLRLEVYFWCKFVSPTGNLKPNAFSVNLGEKILCEICVKPNSTGKIRGNNNFIANAKWF